MGVAALFGDAAVFEGALLVLAVADGATSAVAVAVAPRGCPVVLGSTAGFREKASMSNRIDTAAPSEITATHRPRCADVEANAGGGTVGAKATAASVVGSPVLWTNDARNAGALPIPARR